MDPKSSETIHRQAGRPALLISVSSTDSRQTRVPQHHAADAGFLVKQSLPVKSQKRHSRKINTFHRRIIRAKADLRGDVVLLLTGRALGEMNPDVLRQFWISASQLPAHPGGPMSEHFPAGNSAMRQTVTRLKQTEAGAEEPDRDCDQQRRRSSRDLRGHSHPALPLKSTNHSADRSFGTGLPAIFTV